MRVEIYGDGPMAKPYEIAATLIRDWGAGGEDNQRALLHVSDSQFGELIRRIGLAIADARKKALNDAAHKVQASCPACNGSGHADDSTESNPVQCMYCGIPMSAIYDLSRNGNKTPETDCPI
jgi:hypothetical protein